MTQDWNKNKKMKAITITSALKQANLNLLAIGAIQVFNAVPKSFVSLNYNSGQRTDGYNKLDNSIHETDGFYDVITPVIDASIQKLGAIVWDATNSVFTYPIITKTQEEQKDFIQQQEDNDQASLTIQEHKSNGVLGFDRAMALIERRFINSIITGSQAKALAEGLYPELEPLYKGQWRLVKLKLDQVTPPTNQDLLDIFNLIKQSVDTYVSDNY